MNRSRTLFLAPLLLVAVACAGPSAEAGRGPTSSAPAVATSGVAPEATPVAPPAPPPPARVEETRVICEYVRRSGSNIAVRECREVNHFVDEAGKKGAENWFRSKPSSPSR